MNGDKVYAELLCIGSNLLDLYCGKLSVNKICAECIDFLHKNNITGKDDFISWLKPYEYRKIELSDHSFWVIKKGLDPLHFVHIHPGKQSAHTLRVRATTLKTVLAIQIHSIPIQKEMNKNLETVNTIRTKYLKLSSVKALHEGKGILKIWKVFESLYPNDDFPW